MQTIMKQYRFKGNPAQYGWDIPLEPEQVYSGDTVVFGTNTLQKILDLGIDPHDKEFEKEWEEVSNG